MPPKQKFIPGLNSRPDDIEMPPKPLEKTDTDYLIEEFLKKRKNPAMCLHEYCQKQKLSLKFKEGPVQSQPDRSLFLGRAAKSYRLCACMVSISSFGAFSIRIRYNTKSEEVTPDIDDNRYVEVRDLLDICYEQNIHYEKMMNKDHKGIHTCTIFLTNRDPIKHSSADREEAVVTAHRQAINILKGYASNDGPLPGDFSSTTDSDGAAAQAPRIPNPQLAQLREQESYAALDRTLQTLPPEVAAFDHQIAAVFLSNDSLEEYTGIGKIVAFGTGNSTIGAENLATHGRCLVDSTATTVARRAFKRYLGYEIVACITGKQSIFEKNLSNPGLLKLKAGFEFHLFLSHPPEGDYKQCLSVRSNFSPEELSDIARGAHFPTFTDDSHGLLRCSNELGYNPNNDHGHLCRAVCCRVYPELAESFPPLYRVNHPVLSFSLSPEIRELFRPGIMLSPYSINWSGRDAKAELTDCISGRSNPASPFQVSKGLVSRQCKAGLHLKWFKDIIDKLMPNVFGDKNPAEIKAMAQDYQQVKAAFFQHCLENSIGQWVHVPQGPWTSSY
ncbi:double-stranded RNA-specific adenosine deaminase [Elysia marginata]|uniref:Double-stranded RNA-specific adenosine deaminase n=1 Tax=Elysia marginata TaxID=1093978 RepID=A0AAV4G197_9GAST|nr:double-stranded RNA-specific adenosine deaminase [Elysia marginata]